MKRTLVPFLLFLPVFAFAITGYNAGDPLKVLAQSGLVLREKPDPAGAKILTISYGDTVTVLKEGLRKTKNTVVVFKGYSINGFWVKVRTADNKEGWVFDGYLSRYTAPIQQEYAGETGDYSMLELYIMETTKPKGKRIDLPKVESRYTRYKQLFANGTEVMVDEGDGGAAYTVTFNKGTTIEEAYLIGKAYWMKDVAVKSTIAKGVITVTSEDEMMQFEVENKVGVVVLTMSVAD